MSALSIAPGRSWAVSATYAAGKGLQPVQVARWMRFVAVIIELHRTAHSTLSTCAHQ